MTKLGAIKTAVATLLLVAPPLSAPWAETAAIDATISRTMVTTDDLYGGCMVALNVSPSDYNLDCPSGNWVTLDCAGELTSKSQGMRLMDSAQLAFVTGRSVRVTVDDSRKHNGWCFAQRIDVLGA